MIYGLQFLKCINEVSDTNSIIMAYVRLLWLTAPTLQKIYYDCFGGYLSFKCLSMQKR